MAESSAAAAVTAIHAVSLKLPTFLAARPDVWFQQTEAQFNLRNITDSTTQYFYLLTSLDADVAERMAGDVSLTPAVGKYEYLKSKLMGVYGLTDDQKADRLLDLQGLGDWTPSQLCAYIQGLAVDRNSLFRRIFLRQLPEDVRVQLAALGEGNLPELARRADIIMAAKHAQPVINASNHPPRKHSPAADPQKTPFVGTMQSLETRPRPVGLHVSSRHQQSTASQIRETIRPAPSGTGRWPKPEPFTLCVGPQVWEQVPCRYWSSGQRFSGLLP